jgi:hypothetical protein
VIASAGYYRQDGVVCVPIGAGDEEAMPRAHEARGNTCNLFWTLALSEDDLGETLPCGAMLIDASKAQILVRSLAQNLKELLMRSLRCQAAPADIVEEGPQLLAIHPTNALDNVDFGPSWTVI